MNRLPIFIVLLIASLAVQTVDGELLAQDRQQHSWLVSNNQIKDNPSRITDLVSLADLLSELEKRFNVTFLYDHEIVANKFLNRQEASLGNDPGLDLSLILLELGLSYDKIQENMFILLPGPSLLNRAYSFQSVSGTVTDAGTGETLPGVNIVVKGTTTGTSTDANGEYELTVESLRDTLVFSFVGYQRKAVPINGRTRIDVALLPQAISGEELVVVGYGTQSNAKVTSSISQINTEDIQVENRPLTNIQSALIGSVPGLRVSQFNGRPGSSPSFGVRGISSTNVGDPLVLIDGFEGNINDVHPSEVDKISVLKDAAAAAIYGSRAANGVILITTKSGRKNQPVNFTYNAHFSIQAPPRIPSTVNSEEYMRMYNEAQVNDGLPPEDVRFTQEDLDRANSGYYPETVWPKEMYARDAGQRSHSLRVSGGSENTSYSLSLGRISQLGLMRGSDDYNLNSIRLKIESDVTDWLEIGTNSKVANRVTTTVPGTGGNNIRGLPLFPVQTDDGKYVYKGGPGEPSAIARAESGSYDDQDEDTYDIRLFARVKPFENFVLEQKVAFSKTNLSRSIWNNTYDYITLDERDLEEVLSFTPASSVSRDITKVANTSQSIQTLTTLRYAVDSGNHSGSALLGFQTEEHEGKNFSASRFNYPLDNLQSLALGQEVSGLGNSSNEYLSFAVVSLFGRVNYDFADKYLLEVSFRYDGSSKFRNENRYGFFPSVSAGWDIAQEGFMENVDFINRFKVRASWGQLGDAGGIGDFETTQLVNFDPTGYPFNGSVAPRFFLASPANPNLTWETAEITNIGLDAVLWDGKLSVTPEYYINNRSDILDNLVVPQEYGLGNVPGNIYSAKSWGWELNIAHRNQVGNDFSYFARFNISHYKNKVTDLQGRGPFIHPTQYTDEGLPIRNYYGYEADGYFDTQQEIDSYDIDQSSVGGVYLGGIKYVDQDNNGSITPEDRVVIDENQNNLRSGFTIGASYKGFSVSTHLYGILDKTERWSGINAMQFLPNGLAPFDLLADYWTEENQDALYPRVEIAQPNIPFSTHWYKQSDFIKVKNINLSYQLGNELLNKLEVVKALKLSYSIENLGTLWTNSPAHKYGWDPELGVGNVDYPLPITHSFGLNIQF